MKGANITSELAVTIRKPSYNVTGPCFLKCCMNLHKWYWALNTSKTKYEYLFKKLFNKTIKIKLWNLLNVFLIHCFWSMLQWDYKSNSSGYVPSDFIIILSVVFQQMWSFISNVLSLKSEPKIKKKIKTFYVKKKKSEPSSGHVKLIFVWLVAIYSQTLYCTGESSLALILSLLPGPPS